MLPVSYILYFNSLSLHKVYRTYPVSLLLEQMGCNHTRTIIVRNETTFRAMNTSILLNPNVIQTHSNNENSYQYMPLTVVTIWVSNKTTIKLTSRIVNTLEEWEISANSKRNFSHGFGAPP